MPELLNVSALPRRRNNTTHLQASLSFESRAVFVLVWRVGNEFALQTINSRAPPESAGFSFARANEQRRKENTRMTRRKREGEKEIRDVS